MSKSKFFVVRFSKAACENYDYSIEKSIKNPDKFDVEDYDCNAVQGFTVAEVIDGKATDYFTGDDIVLN